MKLGHNIFFYTILFSSVTTYAEEHDLSIKNVGGKPATQQTQKANQTFSKTINFKDVRANENNNKEIVTK